MIDREALVRRHAIELTRPDPAHVLTVGNGDFAYTADITGMQTFVAYHDQSAAFAEQRLAVNNATMSNWGWHSMPNPDGFVLDDAMSTYQTARGPVQYPDRFDTAAMLGGELPEELRAGAWLHTNPHRIDLGRIGLQLFPAPGAEPETYPEALANPRQRLDLWSGTLTSRFEYAGQEVRVTTVADPHQSRVAFRIESELLASGRAGVVLKFPYASDGFFQTSDWTSPDKHASTLEQLGERAARIRRMLDDTAYAVRLDWTEGALSATGEPHVFVLTPTGSATVLELVAGFSPDDETGSATFAAVSDAAAAWWRDFWTSGAAVDFAGSTDPRAAELERRVVLSQYLTAVHGSGSLPPQESGLVANSWFGKFHLEMHWWHAAHFAAWGRPRLLARSMDWYLSALDSARETARRQSYDGARWPKQVGPDGRESPSEIGALLIWQQPHPLYLLELLHRALPADRRAELVTRFAELVEETGMFMASFVEERSGIYHLPAPVMPAQEFYDARTTEDPTFELAYWWWGLEIAQFWRERLGLERNRQWQDIQDNLAAPHQNKGTYTAIAAEPFLRRDDHPSLLCALGVVPAGPLTDPGVMEATLLDVLDDWQWESAWGWDFPAAAMTATRVGRPDLAVDALLMDTPKNAYSAVGHAPQIGSLLPLYNPANGGLLAAVSLMAAGWESSDTGIGTVPDTDCPGFPRDGSWQVQHEGFTVWP
ncbi:hypothetical protein [Streptomyces violaceusniger]|uniref:Glycoside hydrolase family 65 n=1 Tax=Streptomyces violaceusniger (strain Tu 4113) TaxID=653045 RepID=G2P4W8_STRV4|nr:hypothetical protein [Streptomyces violaceusniger]AEM84145.1 hypothetical protein Strvi_4538 [Streptomyces violaceusniger Tu 4113]